MAKSTKKSTHKENVSDLPGAFELFNPAFKSLWLNIKPALLFIVLPLLIFTVIVPLVAVLSISLDSNLTNALFILLFPLFTIYVLFILPASLYLESVGSKGKKITVKELLDASLHYFFKLWGLLIVVGLIVIVGLILFIIPGLFMIKRYILSPFILIDKETSISDAMKQSVELSKKYPSAIWGMVGVYVVIQLLNFFPIIGGFVSSVLSTIYGYAPAVRYEQLKKL